MKPSLKVVTKTHRPVPLPSLDYEWQERQRIASKDWSRLHIAGDKRTPLQLGDRLKRIWRA